MCKLHKIFPDLRLTLSSDKQKRGNCVGPTQFPLFCLSEDKVSLKSGNILCNLFSGNSPDSECHICFYGVLDLTRGWPFISFVVVVCFVVPIILHGNE